MRKLLALMVLFCGAASADAAEPHKWCSDGFDKPAVIVTESDGNLLLKIEGQPDEHPAWPPNWLMGGRFISDGGESGEEQPERIIYIFRGRAFLPCDDK